MNAPSRRTFVRNAVSWGVAAPPTLTSFFRGTPARAWGYRNFVTGSLHGFLDRTVRGHTIRTDENGLSEASMASIAAAESQFSRRGYATHRTLLGRYGGFENPILAVFEALAAGFGVIGGTGEPFNEPDIFMAAFPNSTASDEETPVMGAPDISGLKSFSNFIRDKFNLDDHAATRMLYPIQTVDPPEYDSDWNSLRKAIYRSHSAHFELKSKNVGTPAAHCSCLIRGDNLFLAEDIPLPLPMQSPCGEVCSPR